ncbi:hypothetical protein QOZ80_7AG0577640 [Eleusine coracana subsp. coracana]|nr:hypothetical protein QOZ80_7AG0577640 [Eleusine coracana subsp. coracana]
MMKSATSPAGNNPKIQSPPSSVDLGDTAGGDNSEQRDMILSAIGDRKEQGPEEIEGFDWDNTRLQEEINHYLAQCDYALPPDDDEEFWGYCDEEERIELNQRLAMYRIRAYMISQSEEGAELEVPIEDAQLRNMYPSNLLEEEGYFTQYERDFDRDWHFDLECWKGVAFQDYQRLGLHNSGDYLDWSHYQETLNTHESDQDFVEFHEKLATETKWIVDFIGVVSSSEWRRCQRLALYHAVKIAAGYKRIPKRLIYFGFYEYIWSIRFDNVRCKEIATLYFEIWKRVTKDKMGFIEAVEQIHDLGVCVCAQCCFEVASELQYRPMSGRLRENYETYLAHIDQDVQEDEALSSIMEAVKKFVWKQKIYYDYAKKKLEIARENGIIPQL